MKDSGIEWIGEIPENWGVKRFKHLNISIETGTTPDSSNSEYYTQDFDEAAAAFVKIGDMSQTTLVCDTSTYLTHKALTDYRLSLYQPGTLLYSLYATIGAVSKLGIQATSNSAVIGLTSHGELYQGFLYYALQSIRKYAISLCTENTQKNLSHSDVKNFYLPVPPVETQHRIADYLDDKTVILDEKIAAAKSQIENLKAYRAALIHEVVCRGVPGMYDNSDYVNSGIQWIGKVPKEYQVKRLKYCAYSNQHTLSNNTDSDYELDYIEIGDVSLHEGIYNTTHYTFSDAPSRARRIICQNDILISTVRTYLKAIAYVDAIHDKCVASTGFAVLTPKSEMCPKYLKYMLTSDYFIQQIVSMSEGIGYPSITIEKLMNIDILVPPQKEQVRIASYLDAKTTGLDNMIANMEQLIEHLEQYKCALIYEVVTGKKEV